MVKILRVDDDIHDIITKRAKNDERTITAYLNKHFRDLDSGIVIMKDYRDGSRVEENAPLPKNTEPQNLEKFIEKGQNAQKAVDKIISEATPRVSDLFVKPSLPTPLQADLVSSGDTELPCCKNELQPCKHWVWDVNTGEGYKNTLSGRFLEVE